MTRRQLALGGNKIPHSGGKRVKVEEEGLNNPSGKGVSGVILAMDPGCGASD